MADNIALNAGAGGATLATDDDGTAHHQYVKIEFGADNTQTKVATTAGLPVANDSSTFNVTVNAALPAGANAIGKLAANSGVDIGDVDVLSIAAGDNNIGNVDIVTFPAEVHSADFDSGVGTDTTLAFGIAVPASGGAAVITGDAANGLDVDVTRLPALVAGTANIGDVDVLTVPAPLSTTGGGTEATALRVTIASDSTGLVSVDDNGGSLTVDGTVTANAGTGTFTTGGVAAHDAPVSGNPVLAAAEARTTNPTAVADGDTVRLQADDLGRLVVWQSGPRDLVNNAHVSLSVSTTTTLIAAGGAGVFRDITSLVISNPSSTAANVLVFDGLSVGTQKFSFELAADGGGVVLNFQPPFKQTTAANGWAITSSETGVRATIQCVDSV